MADAREYLQPLRGALVPIPAVPQSGVCDTCHSSAAAGYRKCIPCSSAARLDAPELLPISLSVHGGLLHSHLWRYKNSEDAGVRERATVRLAGLLAVFIEHHRSCIGEWELVTCVPSVRRVAMQPVVGKLKAFQGTYQQVLTARSGSGDRTRDPEQFAVTTDLIGARVLLVDDTFTSGAKLFSAVAALGRSGAVVLGPVVLGRHLQPEWAPTQQLLSWISQRPWREERCCRCGGERRDPNAML